MIRLYKLPIPRQRRLLYKAPFPKLLQTAKVQLRLLPILGILKIDTNIQYNDTNYINLIIKASQLCRENAPQIIIAKNK